MKGKEQLLQMITASDPSIWEKHDERFRALLYEEIELLFKEPQRIAKAFEEEESEATTT